MKNIDFFKGITTNKNTKPTRETVPSQTSDMGKKTVSVLAHPFLLPYTAY